MPRCGRWPANRCCWSLTLRARITSLHLPSHIAVVYFIHNTLEQPRRVERFSPCGGMQCQRELAHDRHDAAHPSVAVTAFFLQVPSLHGLFADVTQRREVEESPRQRLAALADAQLPLVHPAGSLGEIQPHGLAVGAATAVVTWVADAHPVHAGGGDALHLA